MIDIFNPDGVATSGTKADLPWDDSPSAGESSIGNRGPTSNNDAIFDLIKKRAEKFTLLKPVSGNDVEPDIETYISTKYGSRGKQTLAIAKYIMEKLGYTIAPDVLLMLCSTAPVRIIDATAGAGKTTSLQLSIAIDKLLSIALEDNKLRSRKVEDTNISISPVLYLNYNVHNTEPISAKHRDIIARIKAIDDLMFDKDLLDSDLESTTVHAFCRRWLLGQQELTGISSMEVMKDGERKELWKEILVPRWEKFYGDIQCTATPELLDELYNYKTESMLDWDDFFVCAKFIDSGLKNEFVSSCIKKYDSIKKSIGKYDFIDYLLHMDRQLETNDEFREKLQSRFALIIADENQDFTALMNSILIKLHNPEKNRLIVVGDTDQVIYAFKGVSPYNTIDLCEAMTGSDILSLSTNYRCPSNIVEAGKRVLDLNINRFHKDIRYVKKGGDVVLHPISDGSAIDAIVNQVMTLPRQEQNKTVICYRNNDSNIELTEALYYSDVPYSMIDSRRPFTDIYFRMVTEILSALHRKSSIEFNKNLHRVLPMKKADWAAIFEENYNQRISHFEDFVYPSHMPKGSMEVLDALKSVCKCIHDLPASTYSAVVMYYLRTYTFNRMLSWQKPAERDTSERLIARAERFYKRPLTFDYLMKELSDKNNNKEGVSVSTFHGLKGLEYNHVIAIDFNDSIFPDYSGIETRYPAITAWDEKESENRLCYVLVTRAIKDLHLYYREDDPSFYVKILSPNVDGKEDIKPISSSDSISLPDLSDNQSKLNFIRRLTLGR